MADETKSVELAIDNSKALKALEELRKKELEIAKAQAKGTITANEAAKSIQRVEKERRDLIKVNRVLDDSFGQTTKAVKEETKAVSELDRRLKALDETSSQTRQQVGLAGDVGSAGRTLGGAVGAFGGEGIEQAVSALAEIPDSLEAIAQLKPALAGLPDIAIKVSDSVGLGGLAGKLQTAIPALGGAGAATVALVAPLAAVAAIALPLVVIFGELAKRSEEVRKATVAQFEAQATANELAREGATTNEVLEERIAIENELADAEARLLQAQESRANAETGAGFFDRIKVFEELIIENEQAVRDASIRLSEINEVLVDGSLAANDAIAAEEELAETRADSAIQLQAELAATEQRANQAIQAELAIGQRIVDAQVSRTQAQADADEFAVLEAEIANEVQAEQENDHRDNLTRIASEGQDNLENLQSEFVKLASARGQALTDVDEKSNDKLSDLRDKFFGKQLKSTQKFQRETAKIETDTAKKRTKLLEDLNDRLSDAARDNNVIAFLEAQREGNKALADEAINAQDAEKQRVSEFTRQREEERHVFEAKQAETLAAIQDEKAKVVQAFNERRNALAESVRAEKVAIETRLQAEEQRFAAQELRESITADRQARRDEIRTRQEQRNFDASIAALRNEAQLKQQIHQEELSALQVVQRQIANLQTTASRGTSSRSSPALGSSIFGRRRPNSTARGRAGFTAFHDGGRIKFPNGQTEGFAFVEQEEGIVSKRDMAIQDSRGLPLSMRNGTPGSSGQAIQVTVQDNRTINIGDIATSSAVSDAINRSNEAIVTNIHKMFEGATA